MGYSQLQKVVVLSTLSLSFAVGNTAVFAQNAPADLPPPEPLHRHMMKSPEEIQQMRVRHLQKLHDNLKITATQEAAWQAFQEAYLPQSDKKMPPKPEALAQLTAPEHIEMRLGFLQNEESKLANQLEKTKALYAQLNAEQQAILNKDEIFRPFPGFEKRRPLPEHHLNDHK